MREGAVLAGFVIGFAVGVVFVVFLVTMTPA